MANASLESQITDFLKESNPYGAYLVGFNEYAGKLFIASEENISAALRKARALRSKAETELQRKVLDSVQATLSFDEPEPVMDEIVSAIFVHLVKEGVNDDHMISLLDHASRDVAACKKRYARRSVPVAVKALTLYRLEGVLDILDTVKR